MQDFLYLIPVAIIALMLARKPRRVFRRGNRRRYNKPIHDAGKLEGNIRAPVHHIIDGDTFDVRHGRKIFRVRLAAIDCPESDQPWGRTATYGLIKLIGGRTVFIENHGADDYQRLVGTVYVTDNEGQQINVNDKMVLRGHAWALRYRGGDVPHNRQAELIRIERWARSKSVGLWNTENPIPPWKWRRET